MFTLNERIEQFRQQLIEIAERNAFDFNHPDVLAASQELDILIVEGQRRKELFA
ncbi:aspartyl-phosphate phosphatase Spo0E family protein [Paenibacillus naphthalenovorans]|uniref:aspartyl-phosphate phosphatase Spo0E family protein n=1 Tax=Paenibacillus naphthalenovorans TaxID=162209 RepID=UPI00089089D6|nr:aspartyl-phosphate phosphatase Spo0E family protein [Paenibacillus naphthalenovorans]SDI49998.1 Spo0E like sporulation regulatory protein [Paenibacillus naphthalenovorans]